MDDLVVNDTLSIPARELSWTASTAGGPGGQHVNKVSTKVLLRWDLPRSQVLPAWARERLRSMAGRRFDAEGCVLVSCAATRSQDRNLELARERLAQLVTEALDRPKRRRPTKPSRAAKARRVAAKRRQSQKKAGRGPVHEG
ncbi:aminoacyl-tRNA hydrolase [Pseudenhygromyxa sp. WMMC2535]|uniref:alternative ribosome rescue aminoacyl-tRNA hydrolase ArfB n=1 Tax=Pseudenhygromyxa sp. WMMC2535 TaxID=2712867 RepID=UPI0015576079|nr:alternative ribosome rescue aminoacyl-tRNA hydrolase ArfB [Pseudenhygromyxa sp. WMMC2535]NVB41325.1 aminoacyl-tRNA hydrolase [Pseudenhygromyxa sp. WMMC2535]